MKRDFNGYMQAREFAFGYHKKTGRFYEHPVWRFYVTGFCFDDIHCHVLKSDGTEEMVPIDSKDRITINGKKYGRKFWNH